MAKDKLSKPMGWDVFQSLGDPSNVDDSDDTNNTGDYSSNLEDVVRIYLEHKGRRGKTVSIIKGLSINDDGLKDLCKKLKAKCGVGGSVEDREIMIQGDQRKRLIKELHILGYSNVKNAGA